MPSKDFQSPEWNDVFRPFASSKSAPSNAEVLAEVGHLREQVTEMNETCRQIKAMIYEMWSGESSDVIITPPSPSRSEGVLRLDNEGNN